MLFSPFWRFRFNVYSGQPRGRELLAYQIQGHPQYQANLREERKARTYHTLPLSDQQDQQA